MLKIFFLALIISIFAKSDTSQVSGEFMPVKVELEFKLDIPLDDVSWGFSLNENGSHGLVVPTGETEGVIRLLEYPTGQELSRLKFDAGPILDSKINYDGQFVSLSFNNRFVIWNTLENTTMIFDRKKLWV
jgi:hypothetical protein